MNYKFSGHETFHCRPIWLKKGYDYANLGRKFNDYNSVIDLGVGKNMVASIKFWLRAFGFYNLHKNELEGLAELLFTDDGLDPFLEQDATMYLLHYLLIKNNEVSSINYLAFIKLSKEKTEFTLEQLKQFIKRQCLKEEVDFNEKTLSNDIKVFLKNYIPSNDKKLTLEDNYNGLFYDLRLLNKVKSSEGELRYRFNINDGRYLPEVIFLYVLLDQFEDEISINIEAIREYVSSIFLLERNGTHQMMERLTRTYPEMITFKDDGGRQELQFKCKIDKIELLQTYYDQL